MKRAGQLFERIVDIDNLRQAYGRARIGKRHRAATLIYGERLDENLQRLQAQLCNGSIAVGLFHQFVIHDPKERIITAPCFAERVLHHAIMGVCEPVFETWLIDDTYACRRGRGRLVALHRARQFSHRWPAFLKLDIRKYFDSVPHELLIGHLQRKFKDKRLINLFERIIRGYRGTLGRGLPIGSLTSQHFANFYLSRFDRYVKETLKVSGYVRYMDDMVLWGNSTQALRRTATQCIEFLSHALGLSVKPEPEINRTAFGMNFLGCRVFPSHLELSRRSKIRFKRKLLKLELAYLAGAISERELQDRATALLAFTTAGNVRSWKLRTRVIEHMPVSGQQARTG